MRRALAALALTIAAFAAPSVHAQDAPPQCRQNAQGQVDYQACLSVSPPGSPWRALALINLGTQALQRGDFATAVRHYDDAVPPGQTISSDVIYHSNRALAYAHVGRNTEALVDARIAYRMLNRDPTLSVPAQQYFPPHAQPDLIYASILPVLHAANAEESAPALQQFMALPAIDWVSYVNRAAVLTEISDYQSALTMSTRAVEMAPNEPAARNNHCYILFKLGRPQEGLPHCEAAVARAPDVSMARHSLAEVLGALGRCADAEREMAVARRLDPSDADLQRPVACAAN